MKSDLSHIPTIYYQKTEQNEILASLMSEVLMTSPYRIIQYCNTTSPNKSLVESMNYHHVNEEIFIPLFPPNYDYHTNEHTYRSSTLSVTLDCFLIRRTRL